MAIGRTNAGGGGGTLNFKVIAVSSELLLPATAKENTIAVITDAAITSYVFSSTAPTSPVEGMVWVVTGTASAVGFNAIKHNGLWAYPTGCRQYVSGAWTVKYSYIFIGGTWKRLFNSYLYNYGTESTFGGGWLTKINTNATKSDGVTKYSDNIFFKLININSADTANAIAYCADKIDVTNFNKLTITIGSITLPTNGLNQMFRFGLSTTVNYPWNSGHSYATYISLTATGSYDLDISSLTDEYYVVIYGAQYSTEVTSMMSVTRVRLT